MIFPILIHTSDFLYPTFRYTLIPANKAIDIPGMHKSGFEIEIGPPFGSDFIEVIACTKPSELHKQFAQHAAKAEPEAPFQVLTRGMAVKCIDKSVASATESSDAPPPLVPGFDRCQHLHEAVKNFFLLIHQPLNPKIPNNV